MRVASLRRAAAVGLAATLLVTGVTRAPHASAATGVEAQLENISKTSIARASTNFASLHGPKAGGSNANVAFFSLAAPFRTLCPACTIADEYATADTRERYVVQFNWNVPSKWSRTQTLAYITTHVGAFARGFKLAHGTTDGEAYVDWTDAASGKFVYAETYSSKTQSGFEVRIGHYLPANLRYVPYARLNATQRANLGNAVRNFVQLGMTNAGDNFASLRGAATDKDNNYFHTNVSFGEFLKLCDVDGIFADEAASGSGTSKWFLECETPDIGGAKGDIEEIIRAAAVSAMSGYTPTTDPKYLGTNDYRWDRSSDSSEVSIWAYDNSDGTFTYHVEMTHFTSP